MGGSVSDRLMDRENEKRIGHCECSLWADKSCVMRNINIESFGLVKKKKNIMLTQKSAPKIHPTNEWPL